MGELAKATGLTIRTLHHFDDVGLLRPAARSPSGHRLYTADDVRRLYRIIALRQLGLPLREIARALDGDASDLGASVRTQLDHVERVIADHHHMRQMLRALAQAIQKEHEPSVDQLIATMEAIMQGSHFSPDQLERARRRHQEPGFAERFARWRERCAALVAELRTEIRLETDPADPAAQALARRWNEAMLEMVEGDRRTLSAIYKKIEAKGPEAATQGILDAETWSYLSRTFAAGFR
ncbi:MerR family transcriptional regulator [Actinomadura sp. NBRC 104412]|nr:MerR family transcriptional regulator [Actinomadura sp. NBRC 104412]